MKKSAFWAGLGRMGRTGVLAAWRRELGAEFEFVRPWLRPTTELSTIYPCTKEPPCDCWHEVREDYDGGLVAVCSCGEEECYPIVLEPAEAMLYAVDEERLGAAIRQAFGSAEGGTRSAECETNKGWHRIEAGMVGKPLSFQWTFGIGTWGPGRVPVYFHKVTDPDRSLKELRGLEPGPCIVATPTEAHYQELATWPEPHEVLFLPLEHYLGVAGPGRLELREPVEGILEGLMKRIGRADGLAHVIAGIHREIAGVRTEYQALRAENVELKGTLTENAARQAFKLIEQLDLDQGIKPPTVLAVFRLYCMEELSAEQVARQCGCSKGTVINRLRILREKTGLDPEALRRCSSQFERMEDDIRESRAAYIHRERLIDEGWRAEDGE